jgi:Ca2+-transporting ATPase
VAATGSRTEIGRIGKSLGSIDSSPTPLHIQTRALVRLFAAAGIGASVFLTISYGLLRGDWLEAVLAGITMAMAILPQEFPLVLTIFLVMGARRISKSQVLARRSAAIEALGAATVLCSDKTGTMTENRMSVAKLVSDGQQLMLAQHDAAELPEQFHALVEYSILASRPDPSDPMEQAFHDLGQRYLAHTEHLHADWALARDYPLAPPLLAMSQAWKATVGSRYVIAAKGAPEAVADLCHLPEDRLAEIAGGVAAMADEGLRVLGVAKATFAGPVWPDGQHDFDFEFVGLLGLADPLRAGVRQPVASAAQAGIRVAMITGDHPATARAIAAQAGIVSDGVLTGPEIAEMDAAALQSRLSDVAVFARIMPEQKLRLVQAYAAAGEVVVMTGDGVNDAPSLKAAHIGVAMGGRGTDVAREAAALVLLDDDFTHLVAAIRLGRRIDDNLRKAFGYILAVHVPIAGMSLVPVLLGWPLFLGPLHVVFLELIIDPVSSIVFEGEPEEDGVMTRPPRDPRQPLFDRGLLVRCFVQGMVVLAAVLAVYVSGIDGIQADRTARGAAFVTLVLGNLGLALTNRSGSRSVWRGMFRPNRALGLVVVVTVLALGLVVLASGLRSLFEFGALDAGRVAVAAGAAVATVAVNDLIGMIYRKARRRK